MKEGTNNKSKPNYRVIDKAKGCIAKPMPREWYDRHSVLKMENEDDKRLYLDILADRKPYFMKYVYPALMRQYNTYIKNTNKNAYREFKMSIKELEALPETELTERQSEFLKYYRLYMPVGTKDCVMNKICRKFEDKFDSYIRKNVSAKEFDYKILKGSGEYTPSQFSQVKNLYTNYNKKLASYSVFSSLERINEDDSAVALKDMNDEFLKECSKICPDSSALCNLVLDMCYTRSATKRFAWSMCGEQIINNLLDKHNGMALYLKKCDGGDVTYCGESFSVASVNIREFKEKENVNSIG